MATVGGVRDVSGNQNSLAIDGLARFAVEEHNKKQVSFMLISYCIIPMIAFVPNKYDFVLDPSSCNIFLVNIRFGSSQFSSKTQIFCYLSK